jgi:hypothetical protein
MAATPGMPEVNPKLRPVRPVRDFWLDLVFCRAGREVFWYVKVSGIVAPRRLKASRWAAVGSVSIGTVTWLPVNRTWLATRRIF